MVKKIVKSLLKKYGYTIKSSSIPELTMDGAIKRCVERGLKVNSVIDVGASNGSWSRICMNHIPNAKYLLIEAQEPHKTELEKFKSGHNNVDFVLAAAGHKTGKIYFNNSDLLSGVASETPFANNCIEVPVTTIDIEIKKHNLKPPFLIKLDTHGFEIPILKGAVEALKQAGLVIIETYNFQIAEGSLKHYQMCDYMEKQGFSSIEMVDFMLRDYDHSLWQMDTFFIPSNNKEFSYQGYS